MLVSTDFVLRPYVPGDAPALVAAIVESTPTLAPWMPWATAQFSMSDALAWIASCEKGLADATCFEFAIFDRTSGVFVGGCGLNQINGLHGFCNLSYWVRQSWQRKGAASAAIRALTDYAWTELDVQRLEIVVAVGNDARRSTKASRASGSNWAGSGWMPTCCHSSNREHIKKGASRPLDPTNRLISRGACASS
jgi:ribosomal-protein-serine acetyltransferase